MELNQHPSMVILEFSEAEYYFIDKYVEQGYLPNFKKLLQKGRQITTSLEPVLLKETHLSPWLIWPSIYTGLAPHQHNMGAYGQENFAHGEKTIWAELAARGYRSGIMGVPLHAVQSHSDKIDFYFPECLKNKINHFILPKQSVVIQHLMSFFSKMQNAKSLLNSLKASWKLLQCLLNGLPFLVFCKIFVKILKYSISFRKNAEYRMELANLQLFIFDYLYSRYDPQFAICHLNYLADMQSHFWRAAEPEKFSTTLSEVDKCFYETIEERLLYESYFKNKIVQSFILADQWVGKWMARIEANPNAVLVVMNGLGQKQYDPALDPNPRLFFHSLDKLMHFAGITEYELLGDKSLDLTINFKNEDEAKMAVYQLSEIKLLAKSPFFTIKQNKHQLFLEANLTEEIWRVGEAAWLENEATGKVIRLFDLVYFNHGLNQETSRRSHQGWIQLYGNVDVFPRDVTHLEITEIKRYLTSYFKADTRLL